MCYVEQGHYGHFSRKPTWLVVGVCRSWDFADSAAVRDRQRLPAWMIERYWHEKAKRIGVSGNGGRQEQDQRSATPRPNLSATCCF